jgi:hypothetical protein
MMGSSRSLAVPPITALSNGMDYLDTIKYVLQQSSPKQNMELSYWKWPNEKVDAGLHLYGAFSVQ